MPMQLHEFTSVTNEDGSQIVRVHGRIANHPDPKQQTEWIDFQFSIDAPTYLSGATLRTEALEKARDICRSLGEDFLRIARQQ